MVLHVTVALILHVTVALILHVMMTLNTAPYTTPIPGKKSSQIPVQTDSGSDDVAMATTPPHMRELQPTQAR